MDHPVTHQIEAEGLVIASATDVGRKRTGNEDSHALWISEDAAVRTKQGVLMVVCDGMGGASAGEVASRLAVDTVVERVRGADSADPVAVLRDAIEAANHAVHTQASANADQRGMGTTCTAMLLRGREVWVGHVGDSRAYLVRGGRIHRLTKDHSLVAELVEKGHLTEAEAKHDHRRNVVTRSVGALDQVQVDSERAVDVLKPGDALVVCSDGLHGQVTDYEIGMIAGEQAPAEACASLIDLANERGGPDNITAVVVRVAGGGPAKAAAAPAPAQAAAREPEEPGRRMPPKMGLLVGAAIAMTALVAVVGWLLMGQLNKPAGEPGEVVSQPGGGAPAVTSPDTGTPPGPGTSAPAPAPAEEPAETPPAETPPAASAPAPATPAVTTPAATAAPKPAPASGGKPGTVRLTTRPFQPSTFFVNGEPQAFDVGFISKPLAVGDHVIRVEGINGGSVEVPVHVEAGASYSLVAELPHSGGLGSIEITLSGASRAQVLVDGAQYPEPAPCTIRGLEPGAHRIVVRARGAKGQGPAEVAVSAGSTARAEYRFGSGR